MVSPSIVLGLLPRVLAPEGRHSIARGVSLNPASQSQPSPGGATLGSPGVFCRPSGAQTPFGSWSQGLTPLAIDCRPSGAQEVALQSDNNL
jgi:hypothetical protein